MPLHLRLLLPTLGLGLGFGLGFIQPSGLAAGLLFIALLLAANKALPERLWWCLSLLACLALAAHLVPGFAPWPLSMPRQISSDAAPYAVRLSWDKLLVGLTLLAWWLGQPRMRATRAQPAWAVVLLTLVGIPLLALALDLVGWQPKWPEELWLWLAVNLGVAVLAEELLFRGLLQTRLVGWLGIWPGILLTAVLFGAVHAPFSPLFAVVAGIAGLGYGLAFHYSGRLSLAVALHGAVNLSEAVKISSAVARPTSGVRGKAHYAKNGGV